MAYCGVNPQGYHGIHFGSFVPKPSFKIRQLATLNSRRDATISGAADSKDYCLMRQTRFPGCSLPEIRVKRLFNKPKKHSRSHTFDSASSERLKFPSIPTTTADNTDAAKRKTLPGEGGHYGGERRVVRNGDPWWKWSRRNHQDHHQQGKHHTHKQRLPHIEKLSVQHRGKDGVKQKAKHVQHNLRQKLPPLIGYSDGTGNLLYSEAEDSINARTFDGKYMYNVGRSVFSNRRYYYSYSRDGIRPCRTEAKVSNACLFDLSNLQPTDPDYASHQQAIIKSMHDELEAVTGALPISRLHGVRHLNPTNLGTKVKQSLNRDHERIEKEQRRQPVVINIDSSYTKPESQKEEESSTAAPVTVPHPKGLNSNHLKALAILQELINILNSTEFVPGSEYAKEASYVSEIPTLSQINLGDFFQKPESIIKQYDRFKKLTGNKHHHHSDTSNEQTESEHNDSHRNHNNFEQEDLFGLTQLLAVHRLQTSNENLSGTDLDSVAAKLTARAFDNEMKVLQNLDETNSTRQYVHFKGAVTNSEQEERARDHRGLDQLLAVQRFQGLHMNLSSKGTADELSIVSEPTYDGGAVLHRHFKPKSITENCDIQSQVVCIDLNEQYNQFSNDGFKKIMKRLPTSRKLVHNVSRRLLVEPAGKPQNSRPDLEVSGEKLKHLYNLGLLDNDRELSYLAMEAEERITVSREQLRKIQEIYDHAGVGNSTISNPEAGSMGDSSSSDNGYLPGIQINGDEGSRYYYSEEGDWVPERMLSFNHSGNGDDSNHGVIEGLHIQTNVEHDGANNHGSSGLTYQRDLSWDLEAEFARVQAMDLQQRLQMEQLKKEKTVLDSVKRDLQRFQETLETNGSSNASRTNSERPGKQRESLLPPPPPPGKKLKSPRLKASKKNEQQRKAQSKSSNLSTGEPEEMENANVSKSEMMDNGNPYSEQQLERFGNQLPDNDLESSSVDILEEVCGERDGIDNQDRIIDHSEIVADTCSALSDVTEEESDGYLSDSDVEANTHLDMKAHLLSQTNLGTETGQLPKSKLEEESYAHTDQIGDSAKLGLNNSMQEQRASTSHRSNTRGGSRPVSKLVSLDSLSHNIGSSGLGSGIMSSTSKGMRGSTLPKSQRGNRTNSSEIKGATINDIGEGPLSVSRPQTVQQIDLESREQNNSSGQRGRLPTRERLRRNSQAQITIADPAQVLAHHKSELARQQLMEAQKKEALLEQEREIQRQEKKLRQAEFEDRMSAAFKDEESEIRRQRKLRAEARVKAEELEKERKVLVEQMKKQQAQKEAQEKARHSAMLEVLRREAERRHEQMMHERGVLEEYQGRIKVSNEWEYAYIDYYMEERFSQQARKIDQSRELKQKQLLHQRMMEAFEFKRRELLEKLKAAQKELMMELALDQGQLDHFLKISRAFMFTYFERVPNQTYVVPQELLL